MAIAVRATATPATASSGTTLVTSSLSLTAGDIIVCCCFDNPSSSTMTFTKTAGTGAISAFTNLTKLTNGAVCGITVGYATVTTTGTVTITATSNATITSGILVCQAYSGASGVGQTNTTTGASGTDIAPNIASTTYANSWCVCGAVAVVTGASSLAAGTGTTIDANAVQFINISGTANDATACLAHDNSGTGLAAATNETLHVTHPSGTTYAAIIFELVQQYTLGLTGAVQSTDAQVASSVRAGTGAMAETEALLQGDVTYGRMVVPASTHQQGTGAPIVHLYDAAASPQLASPGSLAWNATSGDLTLGFRQAQSGTLLVWGGTPRYTQAIVTPTVGPITIDNATHGLGTPFLFYAIYDSAGQLLEDPGLATINTGNNTITFTFRQALTGTIVLAAPTPRYTQVLSAVTDNITITGAAHGLGTGPLLVQVYDAASPTATFVQPASVIRTPSNGDVTLNFRQAQSGTVILAAPATRSLLAFTATTTPPSTLLAAGRLGAASVRVVPQSRNGQGIVQAVATRVASSLRAGTGQGQSIAARVASSLRAASAQAQATASRIASSLRAGTAHMAGTGVPSTGLTRAGAGTLQGTATRVASSLRAGAGQEHANASRVASSLRAGAGQAHGAATRIASSLRTGAGQMQATSLRIANAVRSGAGTVQAASLRTTAAGRAGTGRMAGHVQLMAGSPTSPALTFVVPGTTHALGTAAIFVSVYDTAIPAKQIDAASIDIHPTTFDVIVREAQGQSTTVIVQPAPAPYVFPFGPVGSFSIPGATHALGSPDLVWQMVDANTPARVIEPGSLTIQTTGAPTVDVTFRQNQNGTLILSRGLPAFAQSFPTKPAIITGGTHQLNTTALRCQVYDAVTPTRSAITPGSVTIASNQTVTVDFEQAQAGIVVLSAAAPATVATFLINVPSVQAATGRMGAHPHLVATNPSPPATTVVVLGPTHGFATNGLFVQAYDLTGGTVEPGTVTIDATTFNVVVAFDNAFAGTLILRKASSPYVQAFGAAATWNVNGSTHNLGTLDLFVQTLDAGSPALVLVPDTIALTVSNQNMAVSFLDNQAGTLILSQGLPAYVQSFTGATSPITIAGTTHNLGTAALVWQMWDAGSPTRTQMAPGNVTINAASKDVTLTFQDTWSGTLLLSAAQPSYLVSILLPGAAAIAVAGNLGGSGSPRVTTNLRGSTGRQQGQAGPIASAILARTGFHQASASRIASSLRAGTAQTQTQSTRVSSAARLSTAQVQAAASRIASSLRAAAGQVQAQSTRIGSAIRGSTGQMRAVGSGVVPGAVVATGRETAAASRVASSLRAGTGQDHAVATRVASSLRAGTATLQATAARLASSLRAGTGATNAQTTRVTSAVRSGAGQAQAQTTRVASAVRAGAGTVQSTATRIGSAIRGSTGTVRAVGVGVLPGSVGGLGRETAATSRVASSLRTGAGQEHAVATRVASSLRAGSAQQQAVSARQVPTNRMPTASAQVQATRTSVSSSLRSGAGQAHAQTARVASEVLAAAAQIHAVASRIASSLRAGSGQTHGATSLAGGAVAAGRLTALATRVASSLRSQPVQVQSVATRLVSSVRPQTGMAHASALFVSSSLRTSAGQAHAAATRIVSQIRSATATLQAGAATIRSQVRANTAQMQGRSPAPVVSQVLARTAQAHGQAFVIKGIFLSPHVDATAQRSAASILARLTQEQALASRIASSIRSQPVQTQASAQRLVHAIRLALFREQAVAMTVLSAVRPAAAHTTGTATLRASSLHASTGHWQATVSLVGAARRRLQGPVHALATHGSVTHVQQTTSSITKVHTTAQIPVEP